MKSGPEVSFVDMALSLSCARKRLTWAAPGPDGAVFPSGKLQGEVPSGDPREEMAAVVSRKVIGAHLHDAPFIHIARHDVPGGDQVPQPFGGERVDLVVVGDHSRTIITLQRKIVSKSEVICDTAQPQVVGTLSQYLLRQLVLVDRSEA